MFYRHKQPPEVVGQRRLAATARDGLTDCSCIVDRTAGQDEDKGKQKQRTRIRSPLLTNKHQPHSQRILCRPRPGALFDQQCLSTSQASCQPFKTLSHMFVLFPFVRVEIKTRRSERSHSPHNIFRDLYARVRASRRPFKRPGCPYQCKLV